LFNHVIHLNARHALHDIIHTIILTRSACFSNHSRVVFSVCPSVAMAHINPQKIAGSKSQDFVKRKAVKL